MRLPNEIATCGPVGLDLNALVSVANEPVTCALAAPAVTAATNAVKSLCRILDLSFCRLLRVQEPRAWLIPRPKMGAASRLYVYLRLFWNPGLDCYGTVAVKCNEPGKAPCRMHGCGPGSTHQEAGRIARIRLLTNDAILGLVLYWISQAASPLP